MKTNGFHAAVRLLDNRSRMSSKGKNKKKWQKGRYTYVAAIVFIVWPVFEETFCCGDKSLFQQHVAQDLAGLIS